MADLKIYDMYKIDTMTFTEYSYRMRALQYEYLKEEYDRYKLAFAIRDAQATENKGTKNKPEEHYVFQNVNDVLDYTKNRKRLDEGKEIVFANQEVKPNNTQDKLLVDLIAELNNG
ncbi:hypothetical protein [Staphylococcus chromogenes]|uniref:hypothetical protein n=1 Tax=Staphylococcus chromogenes TaxID=46126 RepID=UPI003D7A2634